MNGLQSRTSRSSKFIVLSEKTGLRLGVLPTQEQEGGADTYISVGKKESEIDDGCDDGLRADGIEDGSPLGIELGCVKGSDNGWIYSIERQPV
jgi:hypothetical protein